MYILRSLRVMFMNMRSCLSAGCLYILQVYCLQTKRIHITLLAKTSHIL